MKACSRPMGARFISDRRSVTKGAGALALALFCVLLIAFAQRFGWLDEINVGLMTLAGEGRDTGPGGTVTMVMRLASAIGGTLGRITLLALVLAPLIWAGYRRSAMWLAGMMAVNNVGGVQGRLILNFVNGAGFVGIAVAFMGRAHPIGVALSALLFVNSVIAFAPHDGAVVFEGEDVCRDPVQKPTVVADYYDAPRELDECILKSA